MMKGARGDQAAIRPPSAGPLIPPSRNPPLKTPLARPRCPSGTLTRSRVWAPTVYMAEPRPPAPRKVMSCGNDRENPASTLLTATTAMPAAMTARSPNRSASRPAGRAPITRMSANALTTLAAAAVLTPNPRANSGIAGATIPYPRATVNETAVRIGTSRGKPRNGPRGWPGTRKLCQPGRPGGGCESPDPARARSFSGHAATWPGSPGRSPPCGRGDATRSPA